jgi:predicted ABC-class ATPase
MLKKLGITGLALVSTLAVFGPAAAAQDRFDYGDRNGYGERHERRERQEWRERERRQWREHEEREHAQRERREDRYYNGYRAGFYDEYGYWHPYR